MMSLPLLPARPKPIANELLSSWIIRLAGANGLKLRTFTTSLWPGMAFWSRDIDSVAPAPVLQTLADRTGTEFSRVIATTLGAYEGHVFAKHNPRGITTWVLPVGIRPGSKQATGMQCCTSCLDESLHFRRNWRLAFSTVCVRHSAHLIDACQVCLAPIRIHRGDMGDRGLFDAGLTKRCTSCHSQLISPATPCSTDFESVARFQQMLERAVEEPATAIMGAAVDSVALFAGIHAIAHLLASGYNCARFRRETARAAGVEPFPDGWRAPRRIEHMRVCDRFKILRLVAELLRNWPATMIDVSKASFVRLSDMLFIEDAIPEWYASGIRSAISS